MKYILLISVSLCIYSLSEAQKVPASLDKYINLLDETVKTVEIDKYYLVNQNIGQISLDRIVRKVSEDYVIVKGSDIQERKNNATIYLLEDGWKLSKRMVRDVKNQSREHNYSIKYTPKSNLSFLYENRKVNVIRNIESAGIIIIRTTHKFVLKHLIKNPNIEHVDLAERKPKEESPLRQYVPELSRINLAHHNYPGLNGENLVISLKENSINDDIDLNGRVILDEVSSPEFTQHAKEMGTFMAGAGNSFKTGEGVVTKAHIVCTDFSSLFAEDQTYYDAHNISVQNHSYGVGIENFYGTESISYDQISVDKPELIHFFSAGNLGNAAPETGTYTGLNSYANLTGDFKQSKNVIVVAALDSAMNHESLTSSGPAYDGRIKPELAAFGGEGTSESAAIASGSATMIQEHFFNKNGALPYSSMTKSLLIAGANEAHTPGIDFRTGYGSININRSLQLIDSGRYLQETLISNDNHVFQIDVPDNTAELKVVLSWIDPPANAEDAMALVNDLNMTVTSPNNDIWLPWVLDASPNIFTLAASATRGEDHLNNAEMISLENPEPGIHTVNISSPVLQDNSQIFSIAYSLKPQNSFEWSFPTASDHLEAGSTSRFRWENTYEGQTGTLSIKYGAGDWEPLASADLFEEQFKYTLKDTSTFAMLRMEVGSVEFVSDTFTVSGLLKIQVENDCDDKFVLSWDNLENTDSFKLFELQSNQLVSVLTTTDTLVELDKSTFSENYYAVRPIHTTMLEGLRSFSVNYENLNQGCYITNFLAFLDISGFAKIELSINVPFEIEQVSILKESGGNVEIFKQFDPENITYFEFEDNNLNPGKHTYTVQLDLSNGEIITSDPQSLFYTDENTIVAFPNPVINDDFVNILNDYTGGLLQLIDDKGNFVRDYDLVNTVESLDLTGLKKGTYFYRIIFQEETIRTGRIVRL